VKALGLGLGLRSGGGGDPAPTDWLSAASKVGLAVRYEVTSAFQNAGGPTVAGAGVVLDGLGLVQQLLDLSGNGVDGAVQTNPAARPVWNLNGAINNAASLTLDGAAAFLETGIIGLTPPWSCAIIASASAHGAFLMDGKPGSADRDAISDQGAVTLWYPDDASVYALVSTVVQPGGSLLTLSRGTSALVFTIDGSTSGPVTPASPLTVGAKILGCSEGESSFWSGDWCFTGFWTGSIPGSFATDANKQFGV
jgi:hypothetical protein